MKYYADLNKNDLSRMWKLIRKNYHLNCVKVEIPTPYGTREAWFALREKGSASHWMGDVREIWRACWEIAEPTIEAFENGDALKPISKTIYELEEVIELHKDKNGTTPYREKRAFGYLPLSDIEYALHNDIVNEIARRTI